MKNREQFRQGDVLIARVKAIPKGAKPVKRDRGRVVLAYGEVTGHAHAIVEPEALLFDDKGDLYLEADGTVTLRHEEHAPITIEPGVYKVTRQREYSPEEIRNVAD
jgi:hypothetical protein